ncbi:MAG: pantoate--beta-alanine ligase [Sneathiella sp.]
MTLTIARSTTDVRSCIQGWREEGRTIAFVPTMGSLHEGHLSLVRRARLEADIVCVSLFVNPKQFGPNEDFETYPREEARDIEKLRTVQADLLFVPAVSDVYPEGHSTNIDVGPLGEILEGAHRPGFFNGVATVVTKLLLQVLPDIAIFGEKDYQQLLVIRKFVQDLDIPVRILGGSTVREGDGLALSSRNAYLSETERKVAPLLHQILQEIAKAEQSGNPDEAKALIKKAPTRFREAGFNRLDYLEMRHAETLQPSPERDTPKRVLAAVSLGQTRLIDNVPV